MQGPGAELRRPCILHFRFLWGPFFAEVQIFVSDFPPQIFCFFWIRGDWPVEKSEIETPMAAGTLPVRMSPSEKKLGI